MLYGRRSLLVIVRKDLRLTGILLSDVLTYHVIWSLNLKLVVHRMYSSVIETGIELTVQCTTQNFTELFYQVTKSFKFLIFPLDNFGKVFQPFSALIARVKNR